MNSLPKDCYNQQKHVICKNAEAIFKKKQQNKTLETFVHSSAHCERACPFAKCKCNRHEGVSGSAIITGYFHVLFGSAVEVSINFLMDGSLFFGVR